MAPENPTDGRGGERREPQVDQGGKQQKKSDICEALSDGDTGQPADQTPPA